MAPKPKEQPSDDGRDAEDKSKHKGDWGSHAHADRVADDTEATDDQISYAKQVIDLLWTTKE